MGSEAVNEACRVECEHPVSDSSTRINESKRSLPADVTNSPFREILNRHLGLAWGPENLGNTAIHADLFHSCTSVFSSAVHEKKERGPPSRTESLKRVRDLGPASHREDVDQFTHIIGIELGVWRGGEARVDSVARQNFFGKGRQDVVSVGKLGRRNGFPDLAALREQSGRVMSVREARSPLRGW